MQRATSPQRAVEEDKNQRSSSLNPSSVRVSSVLSGPPVVCRHVPMRDALAPDTTLQLMVGHWPQHWLTIHLDDSLTFQSTHRATRPAAYMPSAPMWVVRDHGSAVICLADAQGLELLIGGRTGTFREECLQAGLELLFREPHLDLMHPVTRACYQRAAGDYPGRSRRMCFFADTGTGCAHPPLLLLDELAVATWAAFHHQTHTMTRVHIAPFQGAEGQRLLHALRPVSPNVFTMTVCRHHVMVEEAVEHDEHTRVWNLPERSRGPPAS
ncbi:hypothetical protein PTSG_05012 [Salpingoeca rosetta]|uniref:Uncharacterized protein n=1 Tax=Salpingoeca rosetta (strain ATCC 50818 / BSB-021) TaxID=946362 RepID=F2U992_SALR5|nr:uncharacterized protein PTSG_05012 [Salpingoeca rosetta]EGD73295.1 hypothetical protein PTSG_05012 [Salpingoeca rosetta]|eukprot:XP_004994326.1 hypothetical protein PTSG_05012 [Salpingoeca rosetta]